MTTLTGIYPDIEESLYHSGEWLPEPSLSVSGAKTLLKSPALYKHEREHPRQSKAFDFGHAAHAKVLGVGLDIVTVPEEVLSSNGAASTKAAKEWAAEAKAGGKVILKADEVAVVEAMAEKLAEHPIASALLATGEPERSMAWRDPETKVLLRARVDWTSRLRSGRPCLTDYKTCTDADPDEWRWEAGRYGYHMQDAWYREMADALTGEEHAFLFIVQQKTAPYLVSVVELDDDAREVGAQRNAAARRLFLDCMTRDEWPGYAPIVHRIAIPNAKYAKEIDHV